MKPGSLIQCVDDSFDTNRIHHIPNRPKRGTAYMVRDILDNSNGSPGVRLEEIVNPIMELSDGRHLEPTFKIERFREFDGLDELVDELIEESLLVENC